MFLLKSPHRGDSNEYMQYTIFNILKKISLNYPKSAAIGFFVKGLKDEFETAVVNEPSVFKPLKFYCTFQLQVSITTHISSKFSGTKFLLRYVSRVQPGKSGRQGSLSNYLQLFESYFPFHNLKFSLPPSPPPPQHSLLQWALVLAQ